MVIAHIIFIVSDRQRIGDEEPKSPTQSSITLLNTQSRVAMRSMSTSSASMRNRRSRASYRSSRPFYPLNGLFHQPSLLPIPATNTNGQISTNGLVSNLLGRWLTTIIRLVISRSFPQFYSHSPLRNLNGRLTHSLAESGSLRNSTKRYCLSSLPSLPYLVNPGAGRARWLTNSFSTQRSAARR